MSRGRGWAQVPGGGSSSAWRKVRALILARDGYLCQIKGPKCTVGADTVDHVVSIAEGGALLDPTNLRAACQACNFGRAGGDTRVRTRARRTDVETRTVW